MTESRRSLSPAEVGILTEVQDFWGLRNNAREVHLTESDEAVLFVVAPDGTNPVMVNLTNLAAWRADGTLTLDALRGWVQGPLAADSRDRVVTVMMPLLAEGVDVYRPVRAEALPSGWYRVLSQNDQPDDETWAFDVGDVVACEQRQLSNETHLVVAYRRDETA